MIRHIGDALEELAPVLIGAACTLTVVVGLMFVSGCGTSPTVAANAAHAVGTEAAAVLHSECTLQYEQADTLDRIAELDRFCEPLAAAYKALRVTHALYLEAAADGADEEELVLLAAEVADAAAQVTRIVQEWAQ